MKSPDRRWIETVAAITPVAVAGTLICCALPITLVALGAGSVVAAMVSAAPWLTVLSRHKEWVFVFAALLLAVNYWALYRSRAPACKLGGVCHPSHPIGKTMRLAFWVSILAYATGVSASYLALPLALWLGY
ncbi:MAG: hypothetical protein ACE5FJ_08220 [Gemmatimonadales bacterium]